MHSVFVLFGKWWGQHATALLHVMAAPGVRCPVPPACPPLAVVITVPCVVASLLPPGLMYAWFAAPCPAASPPCGRFSDFFFLLAGGALACQSGAGSGATGPAGGGAGGASGRASGERYKEVSKEHDVRKTNIIAGAWCVRCGVAGCGWWHGRSGSGCVGGLSRLGCRAQPLPSHPPPFTAPCALSRC